MPPDVETGVVLPGRASHMQGRESRPLPVARNIVDARIEVLHEGLVAHFTLIRAQGAEVRGCVRSIEVQESRVLRAKTA